MTQDKLSEIDYYDKYATKYGYYEVHPDKEYTRILAESGILNEKTGTVLDLGCGSGAFAFRLVRSGFSVIGIDISTASIRTAKHLRMERNANAEFIVADAEKMPIRDAVFDLIFCGFLLHHMPCMISRVLQEINRILTSKGKLFACEPNALNIGCFIQYHFGKDRTENERALNPKELLHLLSLQGFTNISFKDIGDVEHISRGSVSFWRKILRQLVSFIVLLVNKLPFIPGPYFTVKATKLKIQ